MIGYLFLMINFHKRNLNFFIFLPGTRASAARLLSRVGCTCCLLRVIMNFVKYAFLAQHLCSKQLFCSAALLPKAHFYEAIVFNAPNSVQVQCFGNFWVSVLRVLHYCCLLPAAAWLLCRNKVKLCDLLFFNGIKCV